MAARLRAAFDTGWKALTLTNGWVNYEPFKPDGTYYSNARCRKMSNGLIEVRGLIKSGSISQGSVITTLPAGYRPDSVLATMTFTYPDVIGRLDVWPDGGIRVARADSTYLSIAMTFFGDN